MARIEEIAYNDMKMSLWIENGQMLYPDGYR